MHRRPVAAQMSWCSHVSVQLAATVPQEYALVWRPESSYSNDRVTYITATAQGTGINILFSHCLGGGNDQSVSGHVDRVNYFWPDAVFCKFLHCLTSQCVELGNLQQLVTAVDELKDPD